MCVCLYVRVCVREWREREREREREHVCVRDSERIFSTILQAFVVCSCFILIETPRFMDKFEDIVKDFFIFFQAQIF